MLSRVELEYILKPAAFNSDYGRVLRLRIRRKLNKLSNILQLIAQSEFAPYIQEALKDVIRNCYCVTENCNALQNSVTLRPNMEKLGNSCFSENRSISWWARPDLNRRPSPREGDVLPTRLRAPFPQFFI